jgi:hypothetical protein
LLPQKKKFYLYFLEKVLLKELYLSKSYSNLWLYKLRKFFPN